MPNSQDNATANQNTAPAATTTTPTATQTAPESQPSGGQPEGQTSQSSQVQPTWPDDWRQQFAGGDTKLVSRFERYQSPRDVANALVAAQNRISSGELRSTLPTNATPEQVAAWRAENGIPAAPDKYDLSGNGRVIGKEDQPIINNFLTNAHNANLTNDQAKAAVDWYFQERERQQQAWAQKDANDKQTSEDALRAEWGNDYRRNRNIVDNLMATAPENIREALFSARLPDGTLLGNNADLFRALTGWALKINPVATVVPGVGTNMAASIDSEIATIEKTMRENRAEYNRNESMQARYRELLEARERYKAA